MIVSLPYRGGSKRKEYMGIVANNYINRGGATQQVDEIIHLRPHMEHCHEIIRINLHDISSIYLGFNNIKDADIKVTIVPNGCPLCAFNLLNKSICDGGLVKRERNGKDIWCVDILKSMPYGIRMSILQFTHINVILDSTREIDVYYTTIHKRLNNINFHASYQDPVYEIKEYNNTIHKSLLHMQYMYLYRNDNGEVPWITFENNNYINHVVPEKLVAMKAIQESLEYIDLPDTIKKYIIGPYLEYPIYLPDELADKNLYVLKPQFDGESNIEPGAIEMEKRMSITVPDGVKIGICRYNSVVVGGGAMALRYSV